MMVALRSLLLPLVVVASLGACTSTVSPIDLHDPRLSPESRSFMADTEDAVSISRAKLDDQEFAFAQLQDKVKSFKVQGWPTDPAAVPLWNQWMTRRLDLARQKRDLARASLTLTEHRHKLTLAKTAMRHDLAVYDLKPLNGKVEAARGEVDELRRTVLKTRVEVAGFADQWWKAWGNMAKSKADLNPFFLIR